MGELRTLGSRAQGAAMRSTAPAIAGAAAAAAPLAALALLVASSPLDAAWLRAAGTHLVIVPDPDLPAGTGIAGSRIAAVERLLGSAAAPADDAARQRVLAPWLGHGIDASTLPGLVALVQAPDAATAARIAAVAPGATISATPVDAASGLARLDTALRATRSLVLVLAAGLALASLHLAGRLAVGPARASIRTLAILGERPRTLARRAAVRAGLATGAGALFGAGLALPLLLLAAAGQPSAACLAAAAAAPPLCGGIAGLFAGLRARDAAR